MYAIMHSSAIFQAPPIYVVLFVSCGKVYHKQEVHVMNAFFCIYLDRSSLDNIFRIHWIKLDHVLLKMIMIDSWGTVQHATDKQ